MNELFDNLPTILFPLVVFGFFMVFWLIGAVRGANKSKLPRRTPARTPPGFPVPRRGPNVDSIDVPAPRPLHVPQRPPQPAAHPTPAERSKAKRRDGRPSSPGAVSTAKAPARVGMQTASPSAPAVEHGARPATVASNARLFFARGGLRDGYILSEILGKPKSTQ